MAERPPDEDERKTRTDRVGWVAALMILIGAALCVAALLNL